MKKPWFALLRAKVNFLRSLCRRSYWKLLGLRVKNGGAIGKISCDWPHKVVLGEDCIIQDNVNFHINFPFANTNYIELGDRVFVGRNSQFNANCRIVVGNDCMIASNTTIVDASHNIATYTTINRQPTIFEEIIIGDDVWIGTGAIILKGVSIGKGSVIGAGSVVNKSIPEYQIWAGSPAHFIRNRN
jgi:acetyltransferase-like isoleucine patch superfamily enzyme